MGGIVFIDITTIVICRAAQETIEDILVFLLYNKIENIFNLCYFLFKIII